MFMFTNSSFAFHDLSSVFPLGKTTTSHTSPLASSFVRIPKRHTQMFQMMPWAVFVPVISEKTNRHKDFAWWKKKWKEKKNKVWGQAWQAEMLTKMSHISCLLLWLCSSTANTGEIRIIGCVIFSLILWKLEPTWFCLYLETTAKKPLYRPHYRHLSPDT